MADQPPQQQPPDKELPSSSPKITTTPGKGDKAPKRKLFSPGTPEDAEKKPAKVTPKRRKTTSQPGSPTLLGTPGRSIPLSERQQLALLMQMTAEESPAQGSSSKDTPGAKPLGGVKSKVNNQNNRGETSLHISAIKGDVQFAESLLSQGADVNAQDFAGWTALHESCNHGHPELTQLLLSAGAFVNALGSDDDTPLHDASANGHREVVEILLKHGANPMTYNKEGKTPLDLAADSDIRKLMLNQLIAPGNEGLATAGLKGTTSPDSINLEEGSRAGVVQKIPDVPPKEKITTGPPPVNPRAVQEPPTTDDPYEFTQDNSNEHKITIHWMSPDKSATGGSSCMEITRTIPKAREQSTPVSFSSSSTSDNDLLDPQLQQIMTKPLEDIEKGDSKPGPLVQSGITPGVDLGKDRGLAGLGSLVPPTLQKEPPSTALRPEVDSDQPLFIDEDANLVDKGEKTLLSSEAKKKLDTSGQEVGPKEAQERVLDRAASLLLPRELPSTIGLTEGPIQGVKYLTPKLTGGPEAGVLLAEPSIEENNLKLTITRLGQDKDLVCEPVEKKGSSSSRRSSPVTVTALPLAASTEKAQISTVQKVGAKRTSVCDPVGVVDEKKRRDSPTSQIKLQVVSMQDQGSSSDSTDSKRAWRILSTSAEMAPDGATVNPELGGAVLTAPPSEKSQPPEKQEKQPSSSAKEKTKKHRERSQKSHKKHKHSHAVKEDTPPEAPLPDVPLSNPVEPPVTTPVFDALRELQPGAVARKPDEDSKETKAAKAYYIVKQKQSASGEIKKLLLRTSAPPGPLTAGGEEGPGDLGGKGPEPDTTAEVAAAEALVAAEGPGEMPVAQEQSLSEGGNGGATRTSPMVMSSDQAATTELPQARLEARDGKEKPGEKGREGDPVKFEGYKGGEAVAVSVDGKPPPKITRTLRSNSNLQAFAGPEERGDDCRREMSGLSQPMTRSRRNQLESTSSINPLGDQGGVDSHPRKRKIAKHRQQQQQQAELGASSAPPLPQVPLHQQASSMEQFIRIRREMRKRQRDNILPVIPNMPQRYEEYLMHRKTYLLQGDPESKINRAVPKLSPPEDLNPILKENFDGQENKRHSLRLRHQIEREKLMLAAEQEVLRVYGRGARAMANQTIPFSACMVLNDREVYNMPDPMSQEDGKGNSRQRYNGRHFHSWLHDVDEKYEKIKEDLLKRHQHEAMSLYAIQKLEWELKLQEVKMWDSKKPPNVSKHVPMVEIDRDFDLLPKS